MRDNLRNAVQFLRDLHSLSVPAPTDQARIDTLASTLMADALLDVDNAIAEELALETEHTNIDSAEVAAEDQAALDQAAADAAALTQDADDAAEREERLRLGVS